MSACQIKFESWFTFSKCFEVLYLVPSEVFWKRLGAQNKSLRSPFSDRKIKSKVCYYKCLLWKAVSEVMSEVFFYKF